MSAKLVSKVYSFNRKKDIEGISWGVIITLAFTTIMLLAYFQIMYYGIRDDNVKLRIVGYFFLAVSVFVTSIIGIANSCSKPDPYKPFKDMVKKSLLAFFERINGKMGVRGLEFSVQENHFWIELRINIKKAQEYKNSLGFRTDQTKPASSNSDPRFEDNTHPPAARLNTGGNNFGTTNVVTTTGKDDASVAPKQGTRTESYIDLDDELYKIEKDANIKVMKNHERHEEEEKKKEY